MGQDADQNLRTTLAKARAKARSGPRPPTRVSELIEDGETLLTGRMPGLAYESREEGIAKVSAGLTAYIAAR